MNKLPTICLGVSLLLAVSGTAVSHELEPEEAGHPLRLATYVLHPVGYVLFHGIVKPAHGLVSKPGWREVFGHEEGEMGGKAWEPYQYRRLSPEGRRISEEPSPEHQESESPPRQE